MLKAEPGPEGVCVNTGVETATGAWTLFNLSVAGHRTPDPDGISYFLARTVAMRPCTLRMKRRCLLARCLQELTAVTARIALTTPFVLPASTLEAWGQ